MKESFQYSDIIKKLSYMNMFYLAVSPECIAHFGGTFKKRLICTVNNSVVFQCGLLSLKDGWGYISINSKRMKELKVELGDNVNICLDEDLSELGMEICDELTEVFGQEAEAFTKFNLLTDGKKRTIIHFVAIVKNSDKRIERALHICHHLNAMPDGKVDFKVIYGKRLTF